MRNAHVEFDSSEAALVGGFELRLADRSVLLRPHEDAVVGIEIHHPAPIPRVQALDVLLDDALNGRVGEGAEVGGNREVQGDAGLVADDPRVVAGGNGMGVAGPSSISSPSSMTTCNRPESCSSRPTATGQSTSATPPISQPPCCWS